MFYNLVVDGVETKVTLNKERLIFESNGTESITYNIDDVIGCEEFITGWFWRTEVTRVWLIEHGPSNVLLKNYKVVSGDQRKCFQHDISEMTKEETKRPKRVLVMMNPNGGNRTARKDFRNVVEPVFRLSGMSIDIISSEYPGHLVAAAKRYDFTNTDGIVLLGGDGTYHEVLNILMRKKQEEQGVDINDPKSSLSPLNIPFGLIPTGSKSAWSASHTGSSDVLTAALNIVQGRTKASNVIAVYNCGKLLGFGCALFNCGRITNIVVRSDTNFRWLGRSRYAIVSVWMQLFGNPKQFVYKAKVTFYTSVTERHNNETNETEIFVADRKLTGYTSYTSDTVIYNRTFLDIMTVNGNAILDGNVQLNPYRYLVPKPTMVSSFVLFGTIRPESLRQFSKRIALGKDMDQFPNEVDFVNARGFKFELTENPDDTEPDTTIGRQRMILIDGEKYDLETPTCEIWYKEDVVQIFSSYL